MVLRWGIASAGKVSNDFVNSLRAISSNDHVVTAVAARKLHDAEKFAKEHNIQHAIEGYDNLAKLDDVDIVYIGVVNTWHYEVGKLMLNNGKHILMEKPLSINKRDTAELLELAKKNKVFFMEGIWSRFFPVYKELSRLLEDGTIGDVKHITVSFGFHLEGVDRLNTKELGGGTILDLGVYALQLTQFVYKNLKPIELIGSGFLNSNGVDETATAILKYPGNRTAILSTSSTAILANEAVITGTNGQIRIPQFWCPTTIITPKETLKFDLPASDAKYNFNNSVGLCYEAVECYNCIKAGLLESPVVTHADSFELSELMDKWREALNVVFDVDVFNDL